METINKETINQEDKEEKKHREKKNLIKNVAIVFLIIMLLLTFFSNTIMNYSLPEVSTSYATGGSVTSKVRGDITVEAQEDYDVFVKENHVVKSVKIKVGDQVEKDQLLFTFEGAQDEAVVSSGNNGGTNSSSDDEEDDNESSNGGNTTTGTVDPDSIEGLAEAQEALESMELEYNKALLAAAPSYALDNLEIQSARDDLNEAIAQQNKAKTRASVSAQVDAAQVKVDHLQADVDDLQTRLETVSGNSLKKMSKSLKDKKKSLADETVRLNSLKDELETIPNLDEANANVKDKQKALDTLILTLADKKVEDNVTTGQAALDLKSQKEKIEKQKELIEKLKNKQSKETEVRAKNAGVVKNITCIAGDTVTADSALATIAVTGNGYVGSFSVTKEQSKLVKKGEEAEILNIWGEDITATLSEIKPDVENPNDSRILYFNVTGEDVVVGQSMTLSVGEKSAPYEVTVPNSAIREDNKGKFVLVVNVKSSPLGNRYVLSRADVQVLASDDTNSAVSGGLFGGEYVVTNSTKPLQDKMKVRLADQ